MASTNKPGRWLWLLVGVVVVGWAINRGSRSDGTTSGSSELQPVLVSYCVEGDSTTADITYKNESGDTEQQSDVDVPLTVDDGKPCIRIRTTSTSFLYISAQRGDDNDGDITCAIKIDGVQVAHSRSSGPYTIASCSYP
jgi:hypothetical protein